MKKSDPERQKLILHMKLEERQLRRENKHDEAAALFGMDIMYTIISLKKIIILITTLM